MRRAALCLVLIGAGCTGQIGPAGPTGGGDQTVGGGGGGNNPMVSPTCTTESPGPRLLRQLTRAEYGATVSDLLGIKDPNTNDIPPDPLNRRFANNATATVVGDTEIYALSAGV